MLAITDHWHVTDHATDDILVMPSSELSARCEGPSDEAEVLALGVEVLPEVRDYFPTIEGLAAWIREQGGAPYLCHPYWSGLDPQHYLDAPSLVGLEVFNAASELTQGSGLSSVHWDDILQLGATPFAIATDDTHYPGQDSRNGWTMVLAAERSKEAVIDALVHGRAYGTAGPTIHSIEVEDEITEVRCSPGAFDPPALRGVGRRRRERRPVPDELPGRGAGAQRRRPDHGRPVLAARVLALGARRGRRRARSPRLVERLAAAREAGLMFEAPIEVLTPDAISSVHDQAMKILEEIGVEVGSEAGIELLRGAGQTVDGTRVRLDRGFVMEQVAKAPDSFTLRPRNAAREVHVGGGSMVLTPVGGSPFCSDLERGRRDGTLDAYVELTQMAHAADVIGCLQSGVTEAADLSEISRYLDLDYACLRWSDKPYICYGTAGEKADDAVTMAAIACGGRDAIAETPAIIGIVNPNSPLVWDSLMVECIIAWASAGQPVAMTPFMLAGATAPVSLAAGLSLQIAEALSGVAIAQLVRPGTPCLYGSFFSGVDMRSGGPALGMPEGVLATLAGGQLARHYGLPYRGGGGLCSGNAVDAQSAYETAMALWATYHSGSDLVLHAAGWLEGGLTRVVREVRARRRGGEDVRPAPRGGRGRRRAPRVRRDPRRGPGGNVPGVAAHARALPRMAHHLAPVPLAGPSDVGQAGRPDRRPGRGAGVEEAAGELRGSGHGRRGRRRAAGVHGAPQGGPRRAERSTPRHPLRARPDRARDAAEPLLPGAALHRVRRHEAVHPGRAPRHEGRRRLGCGVHGVLLDLPHLRRRAVRLLAPVG